MANGSDNQSQNQPGKRCECYGLIPNSTPMNVRENWPGQHGDGHELGRGGQLHHHCESDGALDSASKYKEGQLRSLRMMLS